MLSFASLLIFTILILCENLCDTQRKEMSITINVVKAKNEKLPETGLSLWTELQ